ncbi:lipoyl(octanoyl) transferase [Acidocella aminolytica 101 = DSM 11237]|uniref:Octanoyltransferase n=2 Tax=Acidocella TaxID=50709 RepID=A0A0D6PK49_9PROT|nr:lipoate-protein ligase B [Acidocella aminolytica 101 = DSM 11237]GBQ37717.1 lipoate-protein ligase B [Acidocella aminolytica 101 = DSM 11237]SHE51945.1 lipoyl(octanoyl) transferase [Acidocella aminolytica 101 = DSM 11237]
MKNALTWEISHGLTDYEAALTRMQAQVAAIRAEYAQEIVWLVEHPPLYTEGTSAKLEDLQDPMRFPTFKAGRGGQWTYHGPGQRVAYVMLNLSHSHGSVPARDVRCYVAGLERWVIETLRDFDIKGEIREGRVGIWVVRPDGREEKIGAIGVRVSHWVTWHGLSLNVAPDLSHFTGIVPCGIAEHGVTSLHALGVKVSMADVDAALQRNWGKVFG